MSGSNMGAQQSLVNYFVEFPLIPIKSKSHYNAAKSQLKRLLFNPEAKDYVQTLALLIKDYESKQFKFENPSPEEMFVFLMKQRGLKQKDLAHIFGSQSIVSEIINGKRKLNLRQIKQLADYFGLNLHTFL